MITVLFTSAGRRVELVRAFRDALADLNLEGRLVAVDMDPLAPALGEADQWYLVPRVDDPGYLRTLLDICRLERVSLVLPLIDPDILVLAGAKAALEATGAVVAVVSEKSAAICEDKWRTFRFFRELAVPTPATWLPFQPAAAPSLTFPVVVKPRFGSSSKHVYAAQNDRELEFFVHYVADPVLQEFLPGPEITSDVLCDFGGETLSVVSRHRIEVRNGEVAKGRTMFDRRIAEDCCRIAKGLCAAGPITVQCILRDGEHFFTEVNARFGGGVPLAIAAGARPAQWLLELVVGRTPAVPAVGSYETDIYVSRYDESRFLTQQDVDDASSRRL